MKVHRVIPLAVLALLAVVPLTRADAASRLARPRPGAEVGFWASQNLAPCTVGDPAYCPRDLSSYTTEVWDALADTGGVLYLNLVYTSDFGPSPAGQPHRTDGLALVRKANSLGVPVKAWLTAPLSGGSFANEANAPLTGEAVRALGAWIAAEHLRIDEIALDLEFPLGTQPVSDLTSLSPAALSELLRTGIDPVHQCEAIASYRSTIAWAKAHGLRLTATPISFAIDDLADGRLALQDALDIGPGPLAEYDAMYVQAYRNYSQPGSGYVASYFRTMREHFGAKGQASLGTPGQPPYDSLAPLVADVRMLVGLGATAIPIYDFDSMVRTFGADGLRQVIEAGRRPMSAAELAVATIETPYDQLNREVFEQVDSVASALTLAITTAQGRATSGNRFPLAC